MIPSAVEVEHADWPTLKAYCDALGLNARGRSAVVRQRVLDHVAARKPAAPWRAGVQETAAFLAQLGHADEAARLWESTLSLDAPAPWIGLGAAYLRSGELEKALKAFDRAAAMGGRAVSLHRAEVLALGGNPEAAVEAISRLLGSEPGDLRAVASMVTILGRAGRHEQAADVLRQLLEVRPDTRAARAGLAWTLLWMSRFDEAAEAYRQYLDGSPSDPIAWNNYGVALAKAGRLPEARKGLEQALALDASYAEALSNLGCVELAQGLSRGASRIQKASRHVDDARIAANAERVGRAARGRPPKPKRDPSKP